MTRTVSLRNVEKSDLPILYLHQADPEATRMAAFPSRDREAFMAHWTKLLNTPAATTRTIVCDGEVAGNIVAWTDADERRVGYWIGKAHWGKGIATAALSMFLRVETTRPLTARAAKHNVASIRVLQKCGFTIVGEDRFPLGDGGSGEEFVLALSSVAGER